MSVERNINNEFHSAASAIAANTFLRSLAGAAFPLFANQMFNGLGVQWAATLLGCVAAVLVPIPIVFYIYGARLRARSAFAPVMQAPSDQEEEHQEGEKADGLAAHSPLDEGKRKSGENMV